MGKRYGTEELHPARNQLWNHKSADQCPLSKLFNWTLKIVRIFFDSSCEYNI